MYHFMLSLNSAGLALIKSFESFRARPYQDSGGVWTIGYGHTQDVTPESPPVMEEEAEEFLREDLADAQDAVGRLVHVPLNDDQYSALVSLVYNTGPAPLTHTLGALLNEGHYDAAADEFLRWNHADGEASEGLTRRRKVERELFLSSGKS